MVENLNLYLGNRSECVYGIAKLVGCDIGYGEVKGFLNKEKVLIDYDDANLVFRILRGFDFILYESSSFNFSKALIDGVGSASSALLDSEYMFDCPSEVYSEIAKISDIEDTVEKSVDIMLLVLNRNMFGSDSLFVGLLMLEQVLLNESSVLFIPNQSGLEFSASVFRSILNQYKEGQCGKEELVKFVKECIHSN